MGQRLRERGERPAPRMVSVVIPVSNGEGTLGAQLEALAGQTYRGAWEVIVAFSFSRWLASKDVFD